MTNNIFKGIKQINGTIEGFNIETLEDGFIYLIRNVNNNSDGYFYFNGKKYSTGEKIIKERIEPVEAELSTIKDLIIEANRLVENI